MHTLIVLLIYYNQFLTVLRIVALLPNTCLLVKINDKVNY